MGNLTQIVNNAKDNGSKLIKQIDDYFDSIAALFAIWITGKQYKKCIICEKVLPATSFTNSGDGKHINKGICENCIRIRRRNF